METQTDKPKETPAQTDPGKTPVETATATVAAETTTTPTPEELSKQADEFLSGFGYTPPKAVEKKEKKETPAEAPAAPAPTPATEPEKPKEEAEPGGLISKPGPKKGKAKAEEPPATTEIDEDDIADRAAEKVLEKQREETAAAAELAEDELDQEDREVLDAVTVMQANPRFKGRNLVAETKKFWTEEEAYIAKWEQDHPGETFDNKDKEHAGFYRKHQLPYTDTDLDNAQRDLERARMKEEAKREVMEQVTPELNQLKFKDAYETERPKIKAVEDGAVVELAVAAVPEFEALLKDKDGNFKTIDQATFDAMKAADPVAVELLNAEANDLRVRIDEAEKLARLGQYYRPNPDMEVDGENGPFRPHVEIGDIGERLEKKFASLPKKDQIEDGRTFITRADFRKQVEAVVGNPRLTKEQKDARIQKIRESHWYVNLDHIKSAMVHQSASRISKILKTFKKHNGGSKTKTGQQQETVQTAETASSPAKPESTAPPTTVSSSDSVNTRIGAKKVSDDTADEVAKGMFG